MVSSEEHSFKSLGLNSASKSRLSRLSRSVSPWSFLIEPSPWCPRFEEEEEDDDDAAEDIYWSRSRIFSGCRVLYISLYSGWCTLYLVSRFMGIVLLSDLAGWVCSPFFSQELAQSMLRNTSSTSNPQRPTLERRVGGYSSILHHVPWICQMISNHTFHSEKLSAAAENDLPLVVHQEFHGKKLARGIWGTSHPGCLVWTRY